MDGWAEGLFIMLGVLLLLLVAWYVAAHIKRNKSKSKGGGKGFEHNKRFDTKE